jgi:uroporphyrinogen-III synthase
MRCSDVWGVAGFSALARLAGPRYRCREFLHHINRPRLFDKGVALALVLITRPEPGATQTANRVSALGLAPLVAPLLSIHRIGQTPQLPAGVGATLLTSRNAVAGCPPVCHDLPAFAVGEATATCAAGAGFNCIRTADGDAIALAALVSQTLSPHDGTLFLPAGRGQGSELAMSLRRKGFRVHRRVVYEAVPIASLPGIAEAHLRHHDVQAAMFFSAETARHFVRLIRAAKLDEVVNNVDAVAISERSSVALRDLPWRRISVASKPNQDAMLALLK